MYHTFYTYRPMPCHVLTTMLYVDGAGSSGSSGWDGVLIVCDVIVMI